MPHLGDEIAVLDGLDDLGFSSERVIPPYYESRDILDASAGANYSGGSSYAPGLPLLPSNAGLAQVDDDLMQYGIAAGILKPKTNVLDASDGANYSGGSSYAEGLPLLPSNAGLADMYDGKPLDRMDDYWGSTMGVDTTAYETTNVLDASSGANYSGGSSYAPGLPLLPSNAGLAGAGDIWDEYWEKTKGVDSTHYSSKNVLDASSGANYSGGSSYAPGLPLLPSNAGLAGLDAVSDKAFMPMLRSTGIRQAFQRVGTRAAVMGTKDKIARLRALAQNPRIAPQQRAMAKQALTRNFAILALQRRMRAGLARGLVRRAA